VRPSWFRRSQACFINQSAERAWDDSWMLGVERCWSSIDLIRFDLFRLTLQGIVV
jgi:hypothetical protein